MATVDKRRWKRAALCGAASSLAIIVTTPIAIAQELSQALAQQQIDIPGGPLDDALIAVSELFGVTVIAPNDLVSGKSSPGASGVLDAGQAIEALLKGQSLDFRRSATGAYIIAQQTAQRAEPEEPVIDDTIVVTGQQIDRSLQETKESVAIFTADEIEGRSLLDIEDVLLQSANVTFSDPGSANISIRGVSRIPFAIGGVGDTSTTFYDDVAITNQAIAFISQNLWDVEQVEFLRGPQSTNLGRNALIGALVVRTNAPNPDEYRAALRAEIGNFGTRSFEGMVNAPITSNTALRITGERSETDGFIDNVTLGTDNDARREFTTVRAKVLTKFSDKFRVTASLQYVEGETASQSYIAPIDGPFDTFESTANIQPSNTFDGLIGSLNLKYDFSDEWKLQSITAFSDGNSDRLLDGDGTERDGGSNTFPVSQFNISQELQASYEGEKLRGIIGGYYLDDEVDSAFIVSGRINPARVGVPQPLLPFYPTLLAFSQDTRSNRETTNFAVFTQWEYSLNNRLTVSAGLRYDRESFTAVSNGQTSLDPSTPAPNPADAGALAEMQQPGSGAFVEAGVAAVNAALLAQLGSFTESTEAEFEAFLPEFGLSYDLAPGVRTSLFYKRGYRAGGAQLDTTGALNEFDPEYLDNIELSLRSQLLDDTLTLNANTYYGFWTNQQVNVPIDGNELNTRTENSGESRIWGVEVEAAYRPTSNTNLFASVGYARTEFVEFCSLSSTAVGLSDCEIDGVAGKDLSGNEFGVSPDWTASFGGQQYLTNRLYAQANFTYQGGAFGDAENRPNLRTNGFFLANTSVGFDGDTYDFRLYARNLFNEFYEIKRFNGELPTEVGVVPGARREFGIIISLRF